MAVDPRARRPPMPRPTSAERKEEVRHMTVALLTELINSPSPGSREAVEQHALTVDGLADELLEADAEGVLLFLGDLAARALESLGEQTGTDPVVVLERLVSELTV
jgi:hypothetical protein